MLGYTQKQVAHRLKLKGIGRISQWENGQRFPGVKNLIKLSVLYRTLVDELYYDLRGAICKEFDGENASPNEVCDDKDADRSTRRKR